MRWMLRTVNGIWNYPGDGPFGRLLVIILLMLIEMRRTISVLGRVIHWAAVLKYINWRY